MVFLRTFGADSNGPGSSSFVGIPQPVGVQNGDLVIIGIVLPVSGVTVTPPDSTWNLIAQTDPAQSIGLVAFWHIALNDQPTYVFSLSASCAAGGTCLVYGGADGFVPIEADTMALTAASFTHNVPAITAPDNGEELALFMGAAASGSYTATGAFIEVARSARVGSTIEAQHKALQAAGTVNASTETFSASTTAAALLICLRPSVGTLSQQDAYNRIIEALPPGIEDFWDLTPTGDYYKYFQVFAAIFKLFVFDLADIARREIVPFLARYKLPDWERLFGLTLSSIAQLGTIPQRQAQILAAWRAAVAGQSTRSVINAVFQPLFGYNVSTPVQVVNADRAVLKLDHSYGLSGDVTLTANVAKSISIHVNDGGVISSMGVQLYLINNSGSFTNWTITLTGPDGTTKTWAYATYLWAYAPLQLYGTNFARKKIQGTWTLTVTSPINDTLFDDSVLFVEGIARGQQTGGAVFDWGVYADPAHLGENGVGANLKQARQAVRKLARAHTIANILQSLVPYPDTNSGVHAAIPDECIPT